jgi:hypothetical protein
LKILMVSLKQSKSNFGADAPNCDWHYKLYCQLVVEDSWRFDNLKLFLRKNGDVSG